ncbi:hypothetical protein [Kocuria sp. CNJ-770]|uniref:hypothetical protein n=1 Tax=Kocuria sp. CNJ-770 TaxID=1904964 RepID=UPI002101B197|nr:hypothetical protein [Kocuria sp. CNJ-770]
MADINPEQARNDPEKAQDALNEESGRSIAGDTPPDAGVGVGPDNPDLDVDHPGTPRRARSRSPPSWAWCCCSPCCGSWVPSWACSEPTEPGAPADGPRPRPRRRST